MDLLIDYTPAFLRTSSLFEQTSELGVVSISNTVLCLIYFFFYVLFKIGKIKEANSNESRLFNRYRVVATNETKV